MANISSASGKITLKGDWTQDALDAFAPVLEMWEFYGEYGIQWCGGFSLNHLTAEFYGCGRWAFTGRLESFEEWTRSWLKDKPQRNGKLIHSLTEEQYEAFLKIMKEQNLRIEIDFEDKEEGFGFHEHEIGSFTSDGEGIQYERIFCEEVVPSWKDYDRQALEAAVDYFETFLEAPDRKKLRKWVKKKIPPTDQYWEEEGEVDPYCILESIAQSEDPMPEFCGRFSPQGQEWEAFAESYEDFFGYPLEPAAFEEDGEYSEDEEEDVNTWDDQPVYPVDTIDALEINGKTFVLTGEFQNFDGDRDQVQKWIVSKGGRCTGAVSGKTNYLVLGDFGEVGARKIEKVMEQREKGKDIKIITESDLFRFLS